MKNILIILIPSIYLYFLFPQLPLTTEGPIVNETTTGMSPGSTFPYRNNSITSVNTNGYMLYAGNEVQASTHNSLDGENITGNIYYISPTGNDAASGSISSPWFSLNKAWKVISPGDIVYLRGGTYKFNSSQELTGKNGTDGNLIKIWAYPGEHPIITRVILWSYYNKAGIYFEGNYFHWKGIEICGFYQIDASIMFGLEVQYSNHNIFELIDCNHNGMGMNISHSSDDNLVLNCDFHHNADPLSLVPFDNADGFGSETDAGTTNTIRGCRSWNNSDDGFDYDTSNGIIITDNCWAWMNGYRQDGVTAGGNGAGYKLGNGNIDLHTTHVRTVTNCLAFHNRQAGFSKEALQGICWIYNNTAYHNADNTNYNLNFQFAETISPYSVHILKNNIAFANQHPSNLQANYANCTTSNNAWNGVVGVTDADFVSLDSTGVSGARQTDGSLPDINFLHLASGSGLIDKGADVGRPYGGNAPDIGAFESQPVTSANIPVYISSVVENATPEKLQMTYNTSLANIVPAATAFSVKVNTNAAPVSSVTISGANVILTLASAIVYGDVVTIAYTKPSSNPLQTISGGQAASVSAQTVTNNCLVIIQNSPPILVITNEASSYSGFIGEIDASGSYDLNNDILTYQWIAPDDVSVSSTSSSKIQFLSPVVNTAQNFEFQLNVSDGKVISSKSISINIMPYKPELTMAKITDIEASSYRVPDYPDNIADGDMATKWSVRGDNQWILLKLAELFKISHLEISFLPGQKYESYFEVFASKDKLIWESILSKTASCNFSGDIQVFEFPSAKSSTEYSYIKLVGHGNSLNTLNSFSEFKTFGTIDQSTGLADPKARKINIYPNPSCNFVNISIEDPTLAPQIIKITDIYGKIVYTYPIEKGIDNVHIPVNFKPGIYTVTLESGRSILYAQKLTINK